MDINLLLEPRGSESPASKKSSASVASTSTAARTYTTAPSAYSTSPAHGASPAYITGSPSYATASPYGPNSVYPPQAPTSAPSVPGAMIGGPVLPAISELQRHPDPSSHPQFRPLYTGPGPVHHGSPVSNRSPPHQVIKRQASQTPLPDESPAKKQSKWTPEEDNLTIELRGQGMKWDDIAKRLPGRSSISCRLRYQNYLEKRAIWDEEKKNKLARLYARYVHRETPGSLVTCPSMKSARCAAFWFQSPIELTCALQSATSRSSTNVSLASKTRCGRR
jgi:hypothetical protein